MNGIAARLTTLLVLAISGVALAAASGSAAGPARAPILGVVPHTGGQLLVAPRVLPKAIGAAAPTSLTFDASYESLINRYFSDVATDSGGTQNVYSAATQYGDGSGSVKYQSTFGGSYVDKDPLPASGCNDGFDQYCLTDQQLETEIEAALVAKGWQGGLTHMFFLMTPYGVGSCEDASNGTCSTNAFCAYHSAFGPSESAAVIYANEPYLGPSGGCSDPAQGFPNDLDSDTTINTISHEHNEAITDPFGDAWIATDGAENGDLCAYGFGTQTGGTAGLDAYNQSIHGHRYDLQEEYSNADNGCVQHRGGTASPPPTGDGSGPLVYNHGPVMHTNTTYAIYWLPVPGRLSSPVVTGTAAVNQTLTSSTGSWTASPTSFHFQWQRCASTTATCANIPGATGSSYTLTSADGAEYVRSTVSATNVNGPSASSQSASDFVVPFPQITKAPHISGRARVGRKLAATQGSWSGSPTSYAFQWLRCNGSGGSCRSIGKATKSTYKPTRHDAKHRLRVRVTALNAAGSTVAMSKATARVPVPKKR